MANLELTPTRREDLAGLLGDLVRLETVFAGWDQTHQAAVAAYRRALEALHGEALRRMVGALKHDPAARAALRGVAGDEVVYAVLRRHDIIKPSLDERVEAALERVRPLLASHGGGVELVRVEPPAIEVRFTGACDGCPSSAMTFHAGVERAVFDACPEITSVVAARATATGLGAPAAHGEQLVSPFALAARGTWHYACELGDIPDGGVKAIAVADRALLVSRTGGAPSCYDNACAHLGLALDAGRAEGGVLTCPHHGFAYDLATGACLTASSVALHPHPVRVVGSRVDVKL